MSEITITLSIPDGKEQAALSGICEIAERLGITKMNARGAPAAKPENATGAKDYFERDKKGNTPTTAPKEATDFRMVRINEAGVPAGKNYLRVMFGDGAHANCFDERLFPLIQNARGKEIGLYLKQSGNYLNIAGVRV